jgi:hypothetical protein
VLATAVTSPVYQWENCLKKKAGQKEPIKRRAQEIEQERKKGRDFRILGRWLRRIRWD